MIATQPRANCSGSPLSVSESPMPSRPMPAMVALMAAATTPIRNVISSPIASTTAMAAKVERR